MAAHHYAIDAAKLSEKCRLHLHSILDCLEERSNGDNDFRRRAYSLIELNDGKFDILMCVVEWMVLLLFVSCFVGQ